MPEGEPGGDSEGENGEPQKAPDGGSATGAVRGTNGGVRHPNDAVGSSYRGGDGVAATENGASGDRAEPSGADGRPGDELPVLCVAGDGDPGGVPGRLDDESERLDPFAEAGTAAAVSRLETDDVAAVVLSSVPDDLVTLVAELRATVPGTPMVLFDDVSAGRLREAYAAGASDRVDPGSSGAYAVLANRIEQLSTGGGPDSDASGGLADESPESSVPSESPVPLESSTSAAPSLSTVARETVATVEDEAGRPAAVLRRSPSGELRPVEDCGSLDADAVREAALEELWAALATGERGHVSAVESDEPVSDVAVHPLGRHGLLIAATAGDADASNATVAAAAGRARATMDSLRPHSDVSSASSERREAEIDALRESLSFTHRVQETLLSATTRAEIERVVCTELAATDWSTIACVGRRDGQGAVDVRAGASTADGCPVDALSLDGGDGDSGPATAALERREPQFETALDREPPFEPWRENALRSGSEAVAALPLVHRDSQYGVLCVYATGADAFDRRRRTILETIARQAGAAINAVQKRLALAASDVVELELRLNDDTLSFLQFVNRSGCEFEFEELTQRPDERFDVFFTVRGASIEEAQAFGAASPVVADLDLVAERDDELLFEGRIRNTTILTTLFEHGAVPRTVTATAGEAHLTVELPRTADVRTFVEMLQTRHPGTELVARRNVDRSGQPRGAFRAQFEDRLTDRQLEILETAYGHGFFQWPRESTGEEVASALDISQPTYSRHLREGQRRLFELLLDD